MKEKKAHIISHTHWDREWYINSPFVNEWLPVFFDSLFAVMEREPEYKFVLDGQTSMLDDCYAELKKLGRSVEEFKEKIRTYAGEGRLVLGPYYLQPDWQLVSGEALIRNLSYGARMSHELGGGTSTGWLLDNFGQIAQAPQIHKLFGMKGLVVWRGIGLEPDQMRSEFLWKSPDGTAMTTSYLLSSYRNAMRLADYGDITASRIRKETEKIAPFSTTGNVLLMNGYDQEMVPDDILPFIKNKKADFGEFTVCQSTPDEFMEAVLDAGRMEEMPVQEGPLYCGRYISVFPGILSSRMYLKQQNEFCQRQLEQYAEPLCTMCSLLGSEYPKEELDRVWKLLLKNHAHDSICGVGVDDVHTDMEERFWQVRQAVGELIQTAVNQLCGRTDTTSFAGAEKVFTLFNPVLRERKETVFLPVDGSFEIRDRDGLVLDSQVLNGDQEKCGVLVSAVVPAFGMCTVGVYRRQEQAEKMCMSDLSRRDMVVENSHIKAVFREDGSLDLLDKKSGKWHSGLGTMEDCADCGDEYNYSYLKGDHAVKTCGGKAGVICVEEHALRIVMKISREWELPESLSPSREERSEIKRKLPIVTYVTIERDSPLVKFRTVLRNVCKDHRLRVLFPTGLKTEESFAHTQFDVTSHPIVPEPFDNDAVPEEVKRIVIGARERDPITQFPQSEFVAVSDGGHGMAVFNQGLPEYEVLPEDTTIALTLFRSVGWLARVDLNTRIGDAGPELYVPDAQCLREMVFEYAVSLFEGIPQESGLVTASQCYLGPILTAENQVHPGTTGDVSFARLLGTSNVRITAVKRAENSDALQLRMYHTGMTSAKVTLELALRPMDAVLVNLQEEPTGAVELSGNSILFETKPKEIVTVQILLPTQNKRDIQPDHICCRYAGSLEDLYKKESFESYPFPEAVSEFEVKREQQRALELESQYLVKKQERDRLAAEVSPIESARLQAEETSLLRASLEARLSALFTEQKWMECRYGKTSRTFLKYREGLAETFRKTAYRLNLARIDKRVSEYLLDYYIHQVHD